MIEYAKKKWKKGSGYTDLFRMSTFMDACLAKVALNMLFQPM